MIVFLYLFYLNLVSAIPAESEGSLENDRLAHLTGPPTLQPTRKKQILDRPTRRSERIQMTSKMKGKPGVSSVSTRDKKNINRVTFEDEANPLLGNLQEKAIGGLPKIAPESVEKSPKTNDNDLQFSEKEENIFNDHELNEALAEILGQGPFDFDLKHLDEKVSDGHLSRVAPVNLKKTRKRSGSKVTRKNASQKSRVDDKVKDSVSGNNLGQAHPSKFPPLQWKNWNDNVPDGHLSGVAPVNLKNTPQNTILNDDEDHFMKLLENYVSNEDWDHYLQHSESERQTHSAVPPRVNSNPSPNRWIHGQPAPIHNARQSGMSIDDQVMKNVLDNYQGQSQYDYDWKNWNDKLNDGHFSGVSFSKLNNKNRKMPGSQNWDFFLQLLEADREKKDPYNPPYAKTFVRSAPTNRRVETAGEIGKIVSQDSSISASKAIGREISNSANNAKEILSKLPRIL